jgi:hypothetical protein
MLVVFRDHPRTLVVGILVSLTTFVIFYLMTVFALSWGTRALGYRREQFDHPDALWIPTREPAKIQVDGTAVILDLDSHAVCLVAAGGDPL